MFVRTLRVTNMFCSCIIYLFCVCGRLCVGRLSCQTSWHKITKLSGYDHYDQEKIGCSSDINLLRGFEREGLKVHL
jgi:hypothetical protein